MRRTLSLFVLAGLCLIISFSNYAQEMKEVFLVTDEMPQPQGGMNVFYQELAKEIRYPVNARKAGIEGRVFVQFTVDKDGSIEGVEVIKGVNPEIDAEAIRALKATPSNWQPGKQKGKNVAVKMALPITFKLKQGQSNQPKQKPLVFLDGVEQSYLEDPKEVLESIQPETIKNVEVIKGAAATALYGDRAQEGIIRINTKQQKIEEDEEILIETAIIVDEEEEIEIDIETEEISPKIRIRSTTSLDKKNPLYILDGKKFEGDLKEINPNNIKSIEVIKDANAVNIYGKEGENGVIIITSKKKVKDKIVEVEIEETELIDDLVMVLEDGDHVIIREGIYKNPLVILDGVPLGNKNDNEDFKIMIDPDNIESVDVLKGTKATALYGTRAMDGVIIIKTKTKIDQEVEVEYLDEDAGNEDTFEARLYPNPFQNQAKLEFELEEAEKVTISLIDIRNQSVKTILDKHLSGGKHQIKLGSEQLDSDFYLIQIQRGNKNPVYLRALMDK